MLASLLASQAMSSATKAPGTAPKGNVRRIDVHHHITPPEYVSTVGIEAIGAPSPNRETPKWNVVKSLEAMDRNDIMTAVVSVSSPGVLMKDPAQTKRLCRACNDFAAGMVADHPLRFGAFSSLPLPDVSAALEEIRYAFETLNTDGIVMMTNYGGRYLGDEAFAPIFSELNSRNAIVYVHPTPNSRNGGAIPEFPDAMIEFPHDSTRAICSLMFSGIFSRCPNIRFIFSHAGGTVPYLATRIESVAMADKGLATHIPDGAIPILKSLYYDTASAANPITFAALMKLVTPENVLLGTDFPFAPEQVMTATLAGLKQVGLSEADVQKIEGENAAALFPRISARL